jgi:hypothetical protein
MKNLILLLILVSGCVVCPDPCPTVTITDTVYMPCDTAKFESWASRKDSVLKARALVYADSIFSERNDCLLYIHDQYRAQLLIINDSLRNIRNNTLIYGDSTRIKWVGFDTITKMPVIIYE